jgi:hypothetical protein
MTVMTLVHSVNQLCMGVESRLLNQRQLKYFIPVKGRWKELNPLNVKNVVMKSSKCISCSLRGLELLQGIHNT